MMQKLTKITQFVLWYCFLGIIFLGCEKQNNFDGMGMFESDEILISAESSGKIIEFDLQEGDTIRKEETIAKLDSKQLELQRDKLHTQIKNAKREKERLERLIKDNADTEKNLDNAIFAYEVLLKDLALLEEEISRKTITSPIDGVILEKYAYRGELATPNKPLCKIANTNILRLKAYLIQEDITRLKLGDEVKVFVDFDNTHKEYKGKVSFIADKAEFTPKTIMTKDERENLVYAIKVDVYNDGFLKIGAYGEVQIQSPKAPQ